MRSPSRFVFAFIMAMVALVPSVSANTAPTINLLSSKHVEAGSHVRVRASASDLDQDSLAFHWEQVAGDTVTKLRGTDTDTLTFTAPDVTATTEYRFKLVVSDGQSNSEAQTDIIVDKAQISEPPTADAGSDQDVFAGSMVSLLAQGYDGDSLGLTFAWRQIAGPIVSFAPTQAKTSFIAPTVSVDTNLQFQLTVSDGIAEAEDDVSILVHPQAASSIQATPISQVNLESVPIVESALLFVKGPTTARAGDTIHLQSSYVDATATYFWRVKNYPLLVTNPYGAETDFTIPHGFFRGKEILFELTVYTHNQVIQKDYSLLVMEGELAPAQVALPTAISLPTVTATPVEAIPVQQSAEPEPVTVTPAMNQSNTDIGLSQNHLEASITAPKMVVEPRILITAILVLAGSLCVLYALFVNKKQKLPETISVSSSSSPIIIYDQRK